MRVLHIPSNLASQMSVLVRAQRDIGVEVRGIVRNNKIIQSADGLETCTVVSRLQHPVRGAFQTVGWWRTIQAAVRWADVVHWHSSGRVLPWDLDLKYIARQGKARLVVFWGSDIRNPEIACRDNPYLARLLQEHSYRYGNSATVSRANQLSFARNGFACMVPGPEMPAYVLPDIFPTFYHTEAALVMADFVPNYPDPQKSRPLVVHLPSRPELKGTDYVLQAVEQLQKDHDFDFQLISNAPHSEAMALVRQSDIVLDAFVTSSFGTVTLEAMALGKPAVCHIGPAAVARMPADFPVVNANPDNLAEVLAALLRDGSRRNELGHRGRAYVEQHHDAHRVARELVQVYEELIARSVSSGES